MHKIVASTTHTASPAKVGDDRHNARLGKVGLHLRCVELARNCVELISISHLHLDTRLMSLLFVFKNEPPPFVELDGNIRDGQE
jgi:hypothetical protein